MSAPPGSASHGRRAAVRRLAGYVARNRGYYAVWLATTLAYTAGFLAVPRLVGWALRAYEQGLGPGESAERATVLALVAVATAGVRFFSRTLVFNAAREIEYEIRNDLFEHLERLPRSFYFRWRTGEIMSRCVNDVNAVRLLLGVGLLNLVQTPILYLGAIGMMLWIDPLLALLVVLPYPAFIWIARALGRSIHHWSLLVQEGLADLSNRLQESIAGIAVVKAYAMEGLTERRFDAANGELYRRQLHLAVANAAMQPTVAVLPALAMLLVLLVGGQAITAGRLAAADFFTFALLIFQLTFPTFIMGWVVALVQRGAASMQRLDELLRIEPTIADRPGAVERELRGEIEFRDLTFRYPGSDRVPALHDVDLRIPAGSALGIVGPVGSGKSTLAALIPRLYEVEDGHVFVDGVDVNQMALRSLRSQIAVVPQESFLFSLPLADNIAFGLEHTDLAAVRRAAEGAQLAKDVEEELPHGYQTVVGERGVMLSGGQRQRAALARALALDPRILILDDTLSAVDAETEDAIQRELAEVFRGRTVIVISSRVSAVADADRIVVMDDGRIVESGTHDELMAARGLYARLAREQEREALEGAA